MNPGHATCWRCTQTRLRAEGGHRHRCVKCGGGANNGAELCCKCRPRIRHRPCSVCGKKTTKRFCIAHEPRFERFDADGLTARVIEEGA